MRAYKLEAIDKKFADTLVDANGTHFKASLGEFGATMLTAPHDTYYYKESVKKTRLVYHGTVGVLHGDLSALAKPDNHVSVAFVIARSGVVYQLFPSEMWSYHLGPSSHYSNRKLSSESVGIELSWMGPLTLKDGIMYDNYNKEYCKEEDTQYYDKCSYRGHEYYSKLTDAQYKALDKLTLDICRHHGITHSFLPEAQRYDFFTKLPEVGIYMHSNIRADKVDMPPNFDFSRISGR